MCTQDNALGRKNSHAFKLVFGPQFAAEWQENTWPDTPSKSVIWPLTGAVFFGLIDADGKARRGFFLTADEAIGLGGSLQRHGYLSQEAGENK